MIGWPTTAIELDPISTEERLRQLFAVYGCNGTEFSYVIFTQRNFTTAERRNGNRRTATEWWKPGMSYRHSWPISGQFYTDPPFAQLYPNIIDHD